MRLGLGGALGRIAVSAAAGGQEYDLVAGRNVDLGCLLYRHFGPVRAMNMALVDRAGLAAVQAPWRIARTVKIDVGLALLQELVGQLDAKPAAIFSLATR